MEPLNEKLKKAFKEKEYCDVELELSDGTILPAHSVVLKVYSDFFRGKLSEDWKSTKISCSEHNPEVMKSVIKVMYEGRIDFSMDTVADILWCADYYGFGDLIASCSEYLIQNTNPHTVLKIMHMIRGITVGNLKERCLEITDDNLELLTEIYKNEFLQTTEEDLVTIIKRNSLSINEESLLRKVQDWAENFDTEQECRDALSRILPNIRWELMSSEFFLTNCLPSGLIRNMLGEQMNKILLHISTLSPSLETEPITRKSVRKKDKLLRRHAKNVTDSTWICDPMDGDRLDMEVNTDCRCRGVEVFGAPNKAFLYSVAVFKGREVQKSFKVRRDCQEGEIATFILFDSSLEMTKDFKYTFVIRTEGGPTCSGRDGFQVKEFYLDEGFKTKVTFSTVDSRGNTTVSVGQLKGVILCSRNE